MVQLAWVNRKCEAVKLGLIECVEMEAEKVRLGRKTQHIKKNENEKQTMHAEQKGKEKNWSWFQAE